MNGWCESNALSIVLFLIQLCYGNNMKKRSARAEKSDNRKNGALMGRKSTLE